MTRAEGSPYNERQESLTTLKLTIAYDGAAFGGFARQPGARTVEGELTRALQALYGSVEGLSVAGRTDAGVHALGNVVSVSVASGPPASRAAAALNGHLPDDLAVLAADAVDRSFSARFDARSRSYRYRIWRRREPSAFEARRALWHPRPLDLEALNENAAALPGRHDFRAFTPTDTHHRVFRRSILGAEWRELDEDVCVFEITADSFLRHMVRTLVGSMLEGITLAPLLDGRPRSDGGKTAPAHGLYLVGVTYSGHGPSGRVQGLSPGHVPKGHDPGWGGSARGYDRADALPRRSLRLRRHRRRLRGHHPRVDAPRDLDDPRARPTATTS